MKILFFIFSEIQGIVMALIPIWFGSKRALKNRVKRLKDKAEGKTGDDLGKGKTFISVLITRIKNVAKKVKFN